MNNKDLEYIFSVLKGTSQTRYKEKLHTWTRWIQLEYLKKHEINHQSRITKDNKKYIDILRKDNSIILTVTQNVYPTNSKSGIKLGMNKAETEVYLKNRGIRTPKSKVYNVNEQDKAFKDTFSTKTNDNVVVKPSNSSLGAGVMVNVSKESFYSSWNYANQIKLRNKMMIVQEYLSGFEARATIMQGHLHSIVLRVPPYVIGNGIDSISKLIDKKNLEREKDNHLKTALIKKDDRIRTFLKEKNLDFNSVPSKGYYELLVSVSNFSLGGELIDITNLVSQNIRDTALRALAAMPGMYTGGLDIIMNSFDDPDPVVLEVNSYPALSLATYPTYGKLENPFKSYVEGIIAVDQFINPREDSYDIKNSDEYIRNILKFNYLRNEIDSQISDFN